MGREGGGQGEGFGGRAVTERNAGAFRDGGTPREGGAEQAEEKKNEKDEAGGGRRGNGR